MSDWIDVFYYSIGSAALLLCLLGLWLTAIVPGIDRWNKRFFLCYFSVLATSCLASFVEIVLYNYPVPKAAMHIVLFLEDLLLSLPMPMMTVYLLHCCGESARSSRLLHAALGLWAAFLVLLASIPFVDVFAYVAQDNQLVRGPWYPLLL